jgi:hypothetical protein
MGLQKRQGTLLILDWCILLRYIVRNKIYFFWQGTSLPYSTFSGPLTFSYSGALHCLDFSWPFVRANAGMAGGMFSAGCPSHRVMIHLLCAWCIFRQAFLLFYREPFMLLCPWSCYHPVWERSQCSSFDMASVWVARVRSLVGARDLRHSFQTGSGAHSHFCGYRGQFPRR